jgi:hypothetical protein
MNLSQNYVHESAVKARTLTGLNDNHQNQVIEVGGSENNMKI